MRSAGLFLDSLLAVTAHPLAHVDAMLNSLAFVLLVIGFVLIKQGRENAHKCRPVSLRKNGSKSLIPLAVTATNQKVACSSHAGRTTSFGKSITLLRGGGCCDVTCDVTPPGDTVSGVSGVGGTGAEVSGSRACAASSSAFLRTWL